MAAFERYGYIGGFPMLFLVDQQGRAYAQTGYQEMTAPEYLRHLMALQATHTELKSMAPEERLDLNRDGRVDREDVATLLQACGTPDKTCDIGPGTGGRRHGRRSRPARAV